MEERSPLLDEWRPNFATGKGVYVRQLESGAAQLRTNEKRVVMPMQVQCPSREPKALKKAVICCQCTKALDFRELDTKNYYY